MELLETLWEYVSLKDLFDILIVTFLIYQVLLIVHGTRAVQMLVGIGVLFVLFWMGISFKLYSLNWILEHFFSSFFIIAIILFQDEFRTALAQFGGGRKVLGFFGKEDLSLEIDEIVEACGALSREYIGALVVVERTNGLSNYINTGTKIKGNVHSDLLYAIFQSSSPLHDGAVIISSGKLAAAGCFLPLSKNVEIDRHLGTRHRAAMGVSELTDAIVVTVSEETGKMTVCFQGIFYPCENEKELRSYLRHLWAHRAPESLVKASAGEA